LSPPTASEPVKPVQQASNEVIKTVTSSAPKTDFDQTAFLTTEKKSEKPAASSEGTAGTSSGGAANSTTPDDKAADKTDTKEVASNDKSGTKNEPVKKMYCN